MQNSALIFSLKRSRIKNSPTHGGTIFVLLLGRSVELRHEARLGAGNGVALHDALGLGFVELLGEKASRRCCFGGVLIRDELAELGSQRGDFRLGELVARRTLHVLAKRFLRRLLVWHSLLALFRA